MVVAGEHGGYKTEIDEHGGEQGVIGIAGTAALKYSGEIERAGEGGEYGKQKNGYENGGRRGECGCDIESAGWLGKYGSQEFKGAGGHGKQGERGGMDAGRRYECGLLCLFF